MIISYGLPEARAWRSAAMAACTVGSMMVGTKLRKLAHPLVGGWHLRYDRAHTSIGRRDHQDVPARDTGSPDAYAFRVDAVQGLGEGDRIAVALDLGGGVDLVARFTIGCPKSRVVVDETSHTGLAEHLSERGNPFLERQRSRVITTPGRGPMPARADTAYPARSVIGGAADDRELVGVGRAIQPVAESSVPVAESSVLSGVPGTGRLVGDDEPQCLDHDVTSFLGLGRARTGLVGYAAG